MFEYAPQGFRECAAIKKGTYTFVYRRVASAMSEARFIKFGGETILPSDEEKELVRSRGSSDPDDQRNFWFRDVLFQRLFRTFLKLRQKCLQVAVNSGVIIANYM